MDYQKDDNKFKELLNQEYSWPARYTFKFIVPAGEEKALEAIFKKDVEIKKKASSGGKYTSLTIYASMANADEIVALYKAASTISGIISL
jgi:putative lipoic acid-binding regulatory protein